MKAALFDLSQKSMGLDAFKLTDGVPEPEISDTQILVQNKFVGLNFVDLYRITGKLPLTTEQCVKGTTKCIIGEEGGGVIVKVGEKVKDLKVGDSVVYFGLHAYAEYTSVDAENAAKVEYDELKLAVSYYLQGSTALAIAEDAVTISKGDWVYIPGVAGGVGQLLTLLIKSMGANVVGSASSQEKIKLAKELGADVCTGYDLEKIKSIVQEVTNGQGVNYSLDPVGKDTIDISMEILGFQGTQVIFGWSSGAVENFDLLRLILKLLTIKASLFPPLLAKFGAQYWLDRVREKYPLFKRSQVREESFDTIETTLKELGGRKTTGKIVLKI